MPVTSAELIEDPIERYPQATVACFDPTVGDLPRRQLDKGRTMAFLEKLAAEGVSAVLIASSTAQGHLRTVEELETWFGCAAAASTGNMLRLALLRPEDGLDANARLLDLVAGNAYPVVFFRPGTDLPAGAGDDAVVESLAPLLSSAAQRGLAVGLYSISDVSGVPLTAEAAARLVAAEGGRHIVAVKVTEADYDRSTARFLAHPALSRLKIVQGWDPHLARALHEGPRFDALGRQRVGITSGLMSLALYQYFHILQAAANEDWSEVIRAQDAANALFQAMQVDSGSFADLQRAKYLMGLGQPITASVTRAQTDRILQALEELPGVADRRRLARSLNLMGAGPYSDRLESIAAE